MRFWWWLSTQDETVGKGRENYLQLSQDLIFDRGKRERLMGCNLQYKQSININMMVKHFGIRLLARVLRQLLDGVHPLNNATCHLYLSLTDIFLTSTDIYYLLYFPSHFTLHTSLHTHSLIIRNPSFVDGQYLLLHPKVFKLFEQRILWLQCQTHTTRTL